MLKLEIRGPVLNFEITDSGLFQKFFPFGTLACIYIITFDMNDLKIRLPMFSIRVFEVRTGRNFEVKILSFPRKRERGSVLNFEITDSG